MLDKIPSELLLQVADWVGVYKPLNKHASPIIVMLNIPG